ncbi:sensor histidine kinase [Flavobacterium beibuense]|uniref:histidine kinase n=1 Tax=Flavobacterium beibuense TaxID=657326 RepID=A0A444WIR4_9FLAO|nr:PAS domain-containing sensor histidine kinase [Flavobacterium beibuense]RYJ45750.1 PAS/PAC sensor signal transduction histidine kinase [Flavobacterium beibuense]
MTDPQNKQKADSLYKKLLNQIPDLIFYISWDEVNGYSILFLSEAVNEIFEYSVEELLENKRLFYTDRILEQDRDAFVERVEYCRKSLVNWNQEFRVQLPKKGLRWMRLNAKPEKQEDNSINFYGRVSDITDQKEQEHQLQVSEERYKFALKAASEGIWDWDMQTNMVYFSAQSMKIIGKEEKEAIIPLRDWQERMHVEDIREHALAKERHLTGETPSFENIYRIKTDEGKYKWVLSRGRVVQFDSAGAPIRSIGTHKDITQLKEKEIELGDTINIVGEQNNRLVNFAHIVSHNLRSHAGNLKMLIDVFKNAGQEEREEMLEHLEAISNGLYVTIGHLKELVEIQFEVKNVKERVNLRHYLKNILNILHNEIKKHGVNIEVNIPLDVMVNYNPAYLESILLNFTTNAIKYSSPDRPPIILYDFEIKDGKKILSITDNGLGIDLKKHKNSLFGMYKTFHKNQNSRGIGLFITKNQIEAMGGSVEVYSEVNKGTTFKIYFKDED